MEKSRRVNGQTSENRTEAWDTPERWRQFVPPKPSIPEKQRQELAIAWLEHVGRPPTDRAVKLTSRHVMLYHPLSPKGQLANELLAEGITPSRYRIESDYPAWRERTIERHKEAGRSLLSDPEVPQRVCTFISAHNDAHGNSPTVLEVAMKLRLPSGDAGLVVLQALEAVGLVTMDGTERGLTLTDAGRALVSG